MQNHGNPPLVPNPNHRYQPYCDEETSDHHVLSIYGNSPRDRGLPPSSDQKTPQSGQFESQGPQNAFVTSTTQIVPSRNVHPHGPPGFVNPEDLPNPQTYYPKSAFGPPQPRSITLGSRYVATPHTFTPPTPHPQPSNNPTAAQGVEAEVGNLNSLSDPYEPNAKPPYPYSTIIRYAIMGSPRQKLTLSELYESMEARFPYYKSAEDGWKNSVRHTLSLSKCFVQVPRPPTEPGKGKYWTYAAKEGEGKVRYRKRNNNKNKKKGDASATPNGLVSTAAPNGDAMDIDHANPSSSGANSTMGITQSDAAPDSAASLEARGLGHLVTIRAVHEAKQAARASPQQDDQRSTPCPSAPAMSENGDNSQQLQLSPASIPNSLPDATATQPPPLVLPNGKPVPHGPSGRARIPYRGPPHPHVSQDIGPAYPPQHQRHVSGPLDDEPSHAQMVAGKVKNGRNLRDHRYSPYEYPGPPPAGGPFLKSK